MACLRPIHALIALCFFVSGATALVCEVVWLRMLGLVFGHTVYAVSTVLAAFMAGLGLGSLLVGRTVARWRNPIRAYGIMEIAVGVSAVLIPALLALISSLYVHLHRAADAPHDAFSLLRFLLAFTVLLIPTTLMGGTLPLLSQVVVARGATMGRGVGALYALNTFGAVLGVALAGYFLLPWLGNWSTLAVAAVANVAIGLLAVAYGLKERPPDAQTAPRLHARDDPGAAGSAAAWPVVALAVSGAASMIYEVAWTRALTLVIGSSTYAFTAMLLAFLVGIAGGAALYAWRWGSRPANPATFAALQIGIGVAAVAALLAFERMPAMFLVGLRWSDSPRVVQGIQLAVSAAVLLPSTLLIGATFPCAVGAAGHGSLHAGRRVGQLYAGGTLGAIAGTLLAGFAFVPAVGVHSTITIGAALNFFLAAALVARRPISGRSWGTAVACGLAGLGVLFVPIWDLPTMASGPAVYARRYLAGEGTRPPREIVFYRDGPGATVAVERAGGITSLLVNGKADASTAPADMPTQLMLAHLPLLLHPEPASVLVIGLGSGITAGAVARHPVQRIHVVEIEPAVIEAASFFRDEHGDVLTDARVRVTIADARSVLLTGSGRYDVITSEPSNPWIGGLASLFSREFFALARDRLEPRGIMLQWIHAYNLFGDDLRTVVETFRTVFPATTVWQVSPGDFLLLGRMDATPFDLVPLKTRFQANAAVRRDLERIGIRAWSGVLGYFALGERDAARYARGARLNTDDHLTLEFSAPRALHLDTHADNARTLRAFATAEIPALTAASAAELDDPEVRSGIAAVRASFGTSKPGR